MRSKPAKKKKKLGVHLPRQSFGDVNEKIVPLFNRDAVHRLGKINEVIEGRQDGGDALEVHELNKDGFSSRPRFVTEKNEFPIVAGLCPNADPLLKLPQELGHEMRQLPRHDRFVVGLEMFILVRASNTSV